MLTTIIKSVIKFKVLVLLSLFVVTGYSIYYVSSTPLDAIPDISDSQVIVYVKWNRSPELIERKVTGPVIQSLFELSSIKNIRSTSSLGYSFIYVLSDKINNIDILRHSIQSRINNIRHALPNDASITLAPNASNLGWIYQYALIDKTRTKDLREIRSINEALIKPRLQRVMGIAEVASVGGLERQIQLKIFPPMLKQTGVSLEQVIQAITAAFQQVGGRTIEVTNRDYHLRATVSTSKLDDIENIVIARDKNNTAILLKDIGYLQIDYDLRRGIADLDGKGEVVGGIVIMEQQQNVITTTKLLDAELEKLKSELPKGMEVITTYKRSSLIMSTLKNFSTALLYELFIVILVVIWALRNGRAAIAPVVIILLGCLYAVMSLQLVNQTINLLSLAGIAIAIGEMADATIVIIENCSAELARKNKNSLLTNKERVEIIVNAVSRLMRPLLFSLVIILVSFLPVFFLQERETRLFDSLAFSKTFAMGFTTLLTLILLPILITWIYSKNTKSTFVKKDGYFVIQYRRLLLKVICYRYYFVTISFALFVISIFVMSGFKKDYMPEMNEGSLLYMPTTLPGIPIREAGWILQQIDKKIKSFPEVKRVFGKLGRADTATDPAPITMIESTILLHPESLWRKGISKEKLIVEMNEALNFIGYVNSWTQPIAGRILMQDSGIQTPVGIKVKGMDVLMIEKISKNIESILEKLESTKSVIAERISNGYYIDIQLDLKRLAKHGVTVDEAIKTSRYAIGGDNVFRIEQEDLTTIPFSIQYSPEYIDTLSKVKNTPVITSDGRSIRMSSIADVQVKNYPEMVRNDNGQLSGYIYIDLNNVTSVDYVQQAKKILLKKLSLPTGYSLEWTGNYQYAQQAQDRLMWIIPITLLIMFSLLLIAFKSVAESFLIILSAPFALIGGVFLQWLQGYPLTTAVIIGYIAVLAIALQTGILMVEFIRDALRSNNHKHYIDAVASGSAARLRPKLMTVATTVFGLLPIILIAGSGMDITLPIAAPSIGGMVSSTIYVLFLIPCLYVIGNDIRDKYLK